MGVYYIYCILQLPSEESFVYTEAGKYTIDIIVKMYVSGEL